MAAGRGDRYAGPGFTVTITQHRRHISATNSQNIWRLQTRAVVLAALRGAASGSLYPDALAADFFYFIYFFIFFFARLQNYKSSRASASEQPSHLLPAPHPVAGGVLVCRMCKTQEVVTDRPLQFDLAAFSVWTRNVPPEGQSRDSCQKLRVFRVSVHL